MNAILVVRGMFLLTLDLCPLDQTAPDFETDAAAEAPLYRWFHN
jgi:hypothetical protein